MKTCLRNGSCRADVMSRRLGSLADPSLPACYTEKMTTRKEASGAGFVSRTDGRDAKDVQFSKANVAIGERDNAGDISLFH